VNTSDWLKTAQKQIDALDARLLLQDVTHLTRADLIVRPAVLSVAEQERLEHLLERRALGVPLAYLTGRTDFYGRRFEVSPAVLIPRPETEELVTLARSKLANIQAQEAFSGPPRILDLGTGSGVIAISLALECPAAQVTATEISAAALTVARANGKALNAPVRWVESDWFAAVKEERFHLVVANPPYIAADDPHLAGDGLRFEPRGALTDEADGANCLRAIVAGALAHLEAQGWLLFEHGYDQGEVARTLLTSAGFQDVSTWKDLAGHERISGGRKGDSRP
jgi:release factor glutamine methyltransferase